MIMRFFFVDHNIKKIGLGLLVAILTRVPTNTTPLPCHLVVNMLPVGGGGRPHGRSLSVNLGRPIFGGSGTQNPKRDQSWRIIQQWFADTLERCLGAPPTAVSCTSNHRETPVDRQARAHDSCNVVPGANPQE